MYSYHRSLGFTLMELAVVLVIIGLIIGGVLVGQDMIKSAEIRATISQRNGYLSAVKVFKDKYNALPGDINQNKALEYGLYDRTSVAATGNGDGNGQIMGVGFSGCSNTVGGGLRSLGGERLMFWRDLSTLGLIDEYLQTAVIASPHAAIANKDLPLYLPEGKVRQGAFWRVYCWSGSNHLALTGISGVTPIASTAWSLTPFEAFGLDKKADDGMPGSGVIRTVGNTGGISTSIAIMLSGIAAAGICVENVGNTYNQATETFANSPACGLVFMRL